MTAQTSRSGHGVQVSGSATLEFRAVNLGDVAAELATPTLGIDDLRTWPLSRHLAVATAGDRGPVDAGRWERLQTLVAQSIADRRRVTTEPEVSSYVAAVVRHHSCWWDELSHAAVDGPAFRQALTEDVGTVLGTQLVAQLVRRPLLGLVSDSFPYFGWASHQELRPVAERLVGAPWALHQLNSESDTVSLRAFRTCVAAAADRRLDLAAIYDVA